MSNSVEVVTPVARIVGGHPMVSNPVIDDKTRQPKMQQDGVTPRTDTYIGLAIPKGAETDWRQTEWGAKIAEVAIRDWPGGQSTMPGFAWKITDGDSQVPNQKGIAPASREGYPGHWIVNAKTEWGVQCFHVGKYDPIEQITDPKAIKPGDFVRVLLDVKGNGSTQTSGIYINPKKLELHQAGPLIVLDGGTSAADAFGGVGVVQQPQQQAIASGPTTPATGFANGPAPGMAGPAPAGPAPIEVRRIHPDGTAYTEAQLKAASWPDAQIAALPIAQ